MVKEQVRRSLDDNVGTRRRVRRLGSAAALLMGLAGLGLTAACGISATAGTSTSSAGAGRTVAAVSAATGVIKEDGSTLLEPLMQNWAMAYDQRTPGVTVTPGGGGSTQGINDASAGAVDIGASDAYLSAGDVLKNGNLLNIPLVVSAQSVIYNLPGLKPAGANVKLTGVVLADMYSGVITMWNDPRITTFNAGITIPPIPVVPVYRKDGSGDTFLFTSYLSTQAYDPGQGYDWNHNVGYGTSVAWPKNSAAQPATGSTGMITACTDNPGCVGYNGVSHLAAEEQDHLGEAMLQNGGGGFALPDAQSIQDEVNRFVAITPPNETIAMIASTGGYGYPIVNYEYAIVSKQQPSAERAALIRNFLSWVVTTGNGSSFVSPVNFQPLPPDLQKLSLDQIGEIG
jgi:phosphate transport system substrate-binding protein